MPRINLIGASNLYTNNTCQFGSMAGLAPTATVRPQITSINGYKYTRAFNKKELDAGCGWTNAKSGEHCSKGNLCIRNIGYSKNIVQYYVGKKMLA